MADNQEKEEKENKGENNFMGVWKETSIPNELYLEIVNKGLSNQDEGNQDIKEQDEGEQKKKEQENKNKEDPEEQNQITSPVSPVSPNSAQNLLENAMGSSPPPQTNNNGMEGEYEEDEAGIDDNKKSYNQREIDPRSFTQDEIQNMNYYITNQIPHSILPRMFVLSEDPMEKSSIFTTIYSIIDSSRYYVGSRDTRKKLKKLLDETSEVYDKLNYLNLEKNNSDVSIGNYKISNQIIDIVTKNSGVINKLRSIFLVFAEKQELVDLDKVTGINTEAESGKDIYSKLGETLES